MKYMADGLLTHQNILNINKGLVTLQQVLKLNDNQYANFCSPIVQNNWNRLAEQNINPLNLTPEHLSSLLNMNYSHETLT